MFRKLALGLVAAASLGAAAIAPTAASAWDGGPHYRGGYDHYRPYHGFGMNRDWRRSHAYYGNRGCMQQRLVPTPYGPRYRVVNVCRY